MKQSFINNIMRLVVASSVIAIAANIIVVFG